MRILINYSDGKMDRAQQMCSASAMKYGVGDYIGKNPNHISEYFRYLNKETLSAERGAGYWLWKPYIINDVMSNLYEDGHILIYADAGVEFVNDVHHIIERMDQDVFLFTNTHPNHHWTKRYTLDRMQPGWEQQYSVDTPWPQVQASVIFFKVTPESRKFVREWLLWCQTPGIINDDPMGLEPQKGFQDHRHDQSVLTILAYQYGYKLHWWPTQYSEHIRVAGDTYPVMFNHHRLRDAEWPNV